jgi:hypothetical protein
VLLAASAQAASEFYCCQDPANGRRVCGDTLPEQCRGRAYRILDSGGNIVKEVGAPLTPEQKAELILENKRRKQLEDAGREQRRRDQALLDTYTTRKISTWPRKSRSRRQSSHSGDQRAYCDSSKSARSLPTRPSSTRKSLPPELEKDLRAIDHEIDCSRN